MPKTADNLALINSESVTRADQFGAVSTQVTQVSATAQSALDASVTNKALIQSETQARVNKDGVFAGQINTVQTQANGNLASIQQHTQSINGLYGQYTLKVDVNGRISGFGLASTNVASAFAINADRFYIVSPDDPTYGDLGFVYNAGTSPDPETGVVMPKGLYLKAAFIKEASISTLKIRGQAVSVTDSAVNYGSTTSANAYLNSGGGAVQVRVSIFLLRIGGGADLTIYKNGQAIRTFIIGSNYTIHQITSVFEVVTTGGYGQDRFHASFTGNVEFINSMTITAVSLKR